MLRPADMKDTNFWKELSKVCVIQSYAKKSKPQKWFQKPEQLVHDQGAVRGNFKDILPFFRENKNTLVNLQRMVQDERGMHYIEINCKGNKMDKTFVMYAVRRHHILDSYWITFFSV